MKKGRGPKWGRPGGAPRKGPPCGGTIPGGPVKSPGGPPGRKGGLKKGPPGPIMGWGGWGNPGWPGPWGKPFILTAAAARNG